MEARLQEIEKNNQEQKQSTKKKRWKKIEILGTKLKS
jgi:hypothetical protein